jgi:hypothetical protein
MAVSLISLARFAPLCCFSFVHTCLHRSRLAPINIKINNTTLALHINTFTTTYTAINDHNFSLPQLGSMYDARLGTFYIQTYRWQQRRDKGRPITCHENALPFVPLSQPYCHKMSDATAIFIPSNPSSFLLSKSKALLFLLSMSKAPTTRLRNRQSP